MKNIKYLATRKVIKGRRLILPLHAVQLLDIDTGDKVDYYYDFENESLILKANKQREK